MDLLGLFKAKPKVRQRVGSGRFAVEITREQRDRVLTLAGDNYSERAIGAETGMSHESARKIIKDAIAEVSVRIDRGMDLDDIAERTDMPIEAVREFARQLDKEQRRANPNGNGNGAAGSVKELVTILKDLQDLKAVLGVPDATAAPAPANGYAPAYDDPLDDAMAQAEAAAVRRVLGTPQGQEALNRRILNRLQGEFAPESKKNPLQELAERQEEYAALQRLLGGNNRGDDDDLPGWARIVKSLLEPYSGDLRDVANTVLSRRFGMPPDATATTVSNPQQQISPAPRRQLPPAAVPDTTATTTAPADAPPSFAGAEPAIPLPTFVGPSAPGEYVEVEGVEPPAAQASAATEDDGEDGQQGQVTAELAARYYQPVIAALMPLADADAKASAQRACDWWLAEDDAGTELAKQARALFGLDASDVLQLLPHLAADPEVGGFVQALQQNPLWALDFYSELKTLLAQEGAFDEEDQPEADDGENTGEA